jgi:LmbE family N-acetylglucosaminyl deacetylase/glycosyltransferase involved in cell wall biosynthesis
LFRLLIVTREHAADRRYGLGKSLLPVVDQLREKGYEILYITQDDVGTRAQRLQQRLHQRVSTLFAHLFPATDFTTVAGGILERLNMGRLAAKTVVREHCTHVHCHDPIIAFGYYWFSYFRRGDSVRWGVTEHGFGCYVQAFCDEGIRLGNRVNQWMRKRERKILLAADWVITPTVAGREQLARDLMVSNVPPHWRVITHPKPQLQSYSRAEARAELGWSEDQIVFLGVGRLVGLKRFELLMSATAKLSSAHLVVLGEGDHDHYYELANQMGFADRFEVTVTDNVGLYLSAADLYISTSVTESFGMANLEAMVAGTASVYSAVGGVPEVVGGGGWLFPVDQQGALEEVLSQIIASPSLAQRLKRASKRRGSHWPDSRSVAEAYISLYQGEGSDLPPPQTLFEPDFFSDKRQMKLENAPLFQSPPLLPLDVDRVIVIAPHPDDETFGCGGTVAQLRAEGAEVRVVVVTDGSKGDPEGYTEDVIAVRKKELHASLEILGVSEVSFLAQEDGNCWGGERLLGLLKGEIEAFRPEWILAPSPLDYHRDHLAVALSVIECWHSLGEQERLFLYEVWTPLPATCMVDISQYREQKQKAMASYQLPAKYCDYMESIEALNQFRGVTLPEGNRTGEAYLELIPGKWPAVVEDLLNLRNF